MVKPFDRGELLARVQAAVRRHKASRQAVVQVGSVGLNRTAREVTVAGTPVRLTGKEFAILELLILRMGTTLSKEALLSHLYGGMDEPESRMIHVFVCKLRRKLALAGAPDFVGTVWGLGYTVRDPSSCRRHGDLARRPKSGGLSCTTRSSPWLLECFQACTGFVALALTELSRLWVRLIAFAVVFGVSIFCVLALDPALTLPPICPRS